METQADLLPANPPDKFEGIVTHLKGFQTLQLWELYIRNRLKAYGLECLVRQDIPKPRPDHQLYEKWNKVSKRVSLWIFSQIQESIALDLISTADDMSHAVIKLVSGYGESLPRTTFLRLTSMKREDFRTAEEFVSAFTRDVQLANGLGCIITPFCACVWLLDQLSKDIPRWVASVEASMDVKFDDAGPETITWDYFQEVCHNALNCVSVIAYR
ncbi:uncharacterized protein P174DRAFT_504916 [Aspergillus novofumigatus IBT 16806]|uniref:Uncharacterized protein n=1 Tax=Aspergillus novofumigatus (strain IBT 16806) TaxID=1392255 RepID=A0A2I1C5C0_ASPN1|nr:uncharacterized protein P174DRAFT_504916 [Aspergillus novofumigatus IBT 16806]PKX92823.1 hypothetical protein P174DRAFT_504916 [Aspergillus novofumigatus IBT 16806]